MKQGLTFGLLVALTAPAFGQVASPGNAAAALPTLRKQTFQHFDSYQAGDYATVDFGFEGNTYIVDLERHSMRAPEFEVKVFGEDGQYTDYQAPQAQTYRGVVRDFTGQVLPGAVAAANYTADGWQMNLDMPSLQDHLIVQPVGELDASLARTGLHAIYRSKDALEEGYVCGNDSPAPTEEEMATLSGQASSGGGDEPEILAALGQNFIKIAFDTDAEFYQANGSDVDATIFDIENLMNLIDLVYERDLETSFQVTTIIVRAVPVGLDPYNSSNSGTLLGQLTTHWNQKQKGVKRLLAHLMTGRDLDGPIIGVATPDVLCKVRAAYALSQSRFSANMANRITLTAHEIGHNVGYRFHCDQNVLVECCTDCHIMCSSLGGCNGVGLPNFGQPAAGFIRRSINNAGCVPTERAPLTAPFVEDFNAPLNPDKWWFNDKIDITARDNVSEPSEPASMKMNANKGAPGFMDDVRTAIIDMSGISMASVSFWHQWKQVENGEQLILDYRAQGVAGWTELTSFTSDGIPQADFHFEQIDLPSDALHDAFQLRFRIIANESDDRWFIDDLLIQEVVGLAVDDVQEGYPTELRTTGTSTDSVTVFFYSLTGTGSGPCLGQTGVCLNLAAPVRVLDVVPGDASGTSRTQLFVPFGSQLSEISIQSVTMESLTSSATASEVVTVPVRR